MRAEIVSPTKPVHSVPRTQRFEAMRHSYENGLRWPGTIP